MLWGRRSQFAGQRMKGVKVFRHIELRHLFILPILGIFHSGLNNQCSNEYGLHYNR